MDAGDPAAPTDAERPLTRQGERRVQEAAQGLRVLAVRPALVAASPLLRAVQTAEIVADVLMPPGGEVLRSRALEPERNPRELFEELAGKRLGEVLCVGHAPHLDRVVALALGGSRPATKLEKAGAACLEDPLEGFPRGGLLWLLPSLGLRKLGLR